MRRKAKTSVYMGIDPGKSGAAVIVGKGMKLQIFDWPKSDNYQLVAGQMEQWSKGFNIRMCVLEKVSSMPKQGVKSMFNFGQNFGAWKMALAAFKIPHVLKTPTQWAKGMYTPSDGKDPKERAMTVACRMFPVEHFYGPRGGKKDGRAEAAIMALVARRIYKEGI